MDVGCAVNQERFADTGRPDQNDILFGVVGGFLAFERQPDMVIMVAQRDAEHFLGFVLFDDKTVKVCFNVARFVIELELIGRGFCRFISAFGRAVGFGLGERLGAATLEMLPDKIGQLALKFLRSWGTTKNRLTHKLLKKGW